MHDSLANLYTSSAKSDTERRGAEKFVAFMVATQTTRQPEQVTELLAEKFVQFMMAPNAITSIRYASLQISRPEQACLYQALAKLGGSAGIKQIKGACSLPSSKFDSALLDLRRKASRWVGFDRDNEEIFIKQEELSARSVVAYCAWLSMLWNRMDLDHNPWPAARRYAAQFVVRKNSDPSAAMKALAQAIKGCDPSSMLGARDMWLMVGVGLLGLSTHEISRAKRSDLVAIGAHRALLVESRKEPEGIVVGHSALTWLNRMEGLMAREVRINDRAARLLAPTSPLWPSLAPEGLEHLSPKSVSGALTSRGIEVAALRRMLRMELRQAGATVKQAGAMMGTRPDVEPEDRWSEIRLAAQQRIASVVGFDA